MLQTKSKVYRLTSAPGYPWLARCIAPTEGDWAAGTFTDDTSLADRLKEEVKNLERLKKLTIERVFIVSPGTGGARMADQRSFSERRLSNGLRIEVQTERAEALWLEEAGLFTVPLNGTPILLFYWNGFMIAAIDSPNILQTVIDAYEARFQHFEPEQLKMHAYFAAPKHHGDKYARIREACESRDVRGSYEYRLPPDNHYPYPYHEDPALRQSKSLCLLLGCSR